MAKQLEQERINLMPSTKHTTVTTKFNNGATFDDNEELTQDSDEPPDQQTPRPAKNGGDNFKKTKPSAPLRSHSLLTQALTSSELESSEDERLASSSKASSCASTAELTSDCDFASCGTRNDSPSPPPPATTFRLPLFSTPDFSKPASVEQPQLEEEHVGPLQIVPLAPDAEKVVEAGLGRKRCIMFAGATKTSTDVPQVAEKFAEEVVLPKRKSTIRFACPTRTSSENTAGSKPKAPRAVSPAPALLKNESGRDTPRAHRDSDSTLRNESPRASRKPSPFVLGRARPNDSDVVRSEATRFHAFASSDDEADDWTQESTVPRCRLTVSDTLRIENGLRKLGEEVEEEEALEEELEDDDDDEGDDDLDDDDDDDLADDVEEESDDGFHTDNEAGFASSDDESEGESDFQWWAPGASTAATSFDRIADAARPHHAHRSFSQSSLDSDEGEAHDFFRQAHKTRKRKSQPVDIQNTTKDLPDSTDFVCGTLDEDRPAEEAFVCAVEKRRAAKHRPTPQDIDPSFPTSDPELDEEDEEDDDDARRPASEESDQHPMVHGTLDSIDGLVVRGRTKRSPAPSPKRLRSPPPLSRRTTAIKSPAPPRRLFGQSPRRLRSPAPLKRTTSPPPTRRTSLLQSPPTIKANYLHFVGLAQRPQLTITASLPRHALTQPPSPMYDEEDPLDDLPSRGAIDIKAGLERKRLRRKEKLYQKHYRKQQREGEKRPQPGKGCERMREIGMEIAAYKAGKRVLPVGPQEDPLMLSV